MEQDAVISQNFCAKVSLLQEKFRKKTMSTSRFVVHIRGLRINKTQLRHICFYRDCYGCMFKGL